jgi:tRNA G46 methylase TrmB
VTVRPVDYDAELTRYSAVLRRAWAVQPHDRVLDVGCGTGQTTREAARMAPAGSALGVDLSAPAIERARTLAQTEGLRNVACTNEFLKRLNPAAAAGALARLRDALAARMSDDGIWFNSRAWIVTARRR